MNSLYSTITVRPALAISVAALSFIINFAIVAGIVIGIITGFRKRTARAAIQLLLTAVSALLTVILMPRLSGIVTGLTKSSDVIDKMVSVEIPPEIKTEAMTAFSEAFPGFVGETFGTIVVFIILLIIMRIVYAFATLTLGNKQTDLTFPARLGGAFLGAVSAVIICGMILMPFLGVYSFAEPVLETTTESPGVEFVSGLGFGDLGKKLVENASEYTVGTDKCYMTDDIRAAAEIYSKATGTTEIKEDLIDYLTDTALMDSMLQSADGSRVIHDTAFCIVDAFLTWTLSGSLTEFEENETFMTRARLDIGTMSLQTEGKYCVPLIIEINNRGYVDADSTIYIDMIRNDDVLMDKFEAAALYSPIVDALMPYLRK